MTPDDRALIEGNQFFTTHSTSFFECVEWSFFIGLVKEGFMPLQRILFILFLACECEFLNEFIQVRFGVCFVRGKNLLLQKSV